MKKSLRSLIRLYEWHLDERRRELADLLRVLGELEARVDRLRGELKAEQGIAGASPYEAGFFFGAYVSHALGQRDRLLKAVADAERQVEAARDEVRQAHQELKKFEITQRERDRLEVQEEDRRERISLDEVGLEGFRRRQA